MSAGAPTYAECRMWLRWLRAFTPAELADAMAVNEEVARRFVRAAAWHGIVEDTGLRLNGHGDLEEPLWRYKPLPPGPTEHPTGPLPERATPGCYELAPVRGVPVRMVDEDRRRQSLPGERHRMVLRQRRWEEQQQAKAAAAEAARLKKRRIAEHNPTLGLGKTA